MAGNGSLLHYTNQERGLSRSSDRKRACVTDKEIVTSRNMGKVVNIVG